MGRYNFVSPGAVGGNALLEELYRREAMRRQRALDEQKLLADLEDRELRRAQINATSANARATREALEDERSFRRATTRVENAWPGDPLSEAEAAELANQGYSGAVVRTPAGREFAGQDPASGEEFFTQTPAMLSMRGGSKFLNQRAMDESRAETARLAREAADQRAADQRDAAERRQEDQQQFQAGQNALTRAITQQGMNIRGEAEARQQATADARRAEADATSQRARENAMTAAQDTLDLIDRLVEVDPETDEVTALKPGVGAQFGYGLPNILQSTLPGFLTGDAADRRADVNRLRARAIVDLLNEMKQQSRTGATGFGALNAAELQILQNGATILADENISNEAAMREMARMRRPLQKLLKARAAGGGAAAPAGLMWDSATQSWK